MPDKIQSYRVVCKGGLNSNENHLELSGEAPGAASRLINYEPSMFGGYRRISGYNFFDPSYPYVGGASAEGPVLCAVMYRNEHLGDPYMIAARKDVGADTYSFYKHVPLTGWVKMTTGFTPATVSGSRTVRRLRYVQFDIGTGSQIVFVDGVNNAMLFDGTNWSRISSAGAGTTASPGGDQAVNAPAIVEFFKNTLFLGGDEAWRSILAYSAPNAPTNFTVAGGAGQVATGFGVVQVKPFRENLFVFGSNAIKKLSPDVSAGFLLDSVTTNVGCIARDSVVEVGGDLVFLAPDGFRPVAGTSRIGDVELETISRPITALLRSALEDFDLDDLTAVVVRSKSQVRYFFDGAATARATSFGVVGGLTSTGGEVRWEFGELLGFRASCTSSEYVGREEYVIHGDFDGAVYRQEQDDTSLAGDDIVAIYSTPYLDFGDTEIRKVLHKVNTFIRAGGPMTINVSLQYDWGDADVRKPSGYAQESSGAPNVYGGRGIVYAGTGITYGGNNKPVMLSDIQGSCFSVRATFVTSGQIPSYSIQGLIFEFATAGRR